MREHEHQQERAVVGDAGVGTPKKQVQPAAAGRPMAGLVHTPPNDGQPKSPSSQAQQTLRRLLQTSRQIQTAVGEAKADVKLGGIVIKQMSTKYKAVLAALDAYHDYIGKTRVDKGSPGVQVKQIHQLLDDVVAGCQTYVQAHGAESERSEWVGDLLNKATLEKRVITGLGKQGDALDGRLWREVIPEVGGESGGLAVPTGTAVERRKDPGLEGTAAKAGKLFGDASLGGVGTDFAKGDKVLIHQTDDPTVVFAELFAKEEKLGSFKVKSTGYTKAANIKAGKTKHEAVGNDVPIFTREPHPDDVNQGAIGDCYLVAALAAIAARNPDAIYKMIKDNGDGTVTVRLYEPSPTGLTAKYISIAKSVISDEQKSSGALWVPLIEKAYTTVGVGIDGKAVSKSYVRIGDGGQADEAFQVLTGRTPPQAKTPIKASEFFAQEAWDPGQIAKFKKGEGDKTKAMALLQSPQLVSTFMAFAEKHQKALYKFKTYDEFEQFLTEQKLDPAVSVVLLGDLRKRVTSTRGRGQYSDLQEKLFNDIASGLTSGSYVAASTKEKIQTEKASAVTKGHSGGEETAEGLVGSHVYTVLAAREIDRSGKKLKYIRLRNPWGKGGSLEGTGRVYTDLPDGTLDIETDPKALAQKAKPEFDLELTDFTKHFKDIHWS